MALPVFPTDDAAEISGTDTEDVINGGHRTRFFPLLNAMLALASYVRGVGEFLIGLAEQVATDAAAAAAGSGTEATLANIRAGADVAHYLSMRRVAAANMPVALTDAASIAWDMAAGMNFSVALGGNRTLANPTNLVPGMSGFLNVYQDGTGGRAIAAYGNQYVWIGPKPNYPVTPGARTKIAYFVTSTSEVELAFAGNSA
jgi:hypothetical protein